MTYIFAIMVAILAQNVNLKKKIKDDALPLLFWPPCLCRDYVRLRVHNGVNFVTDRVLTFYKDFLKMRGQTEVKEKQTKNVSRDNIVSNLKYDFMKNLAQLQRTLRFTLILMAKIRQKSVHSMRIHDLFSN